MFVFSTSNGWVSRDAIAPAYTDLYELGNILFSVRRLWLISNNVELLSYYNSDLHNCMKISIHFWFNQ